MHFYIIYRVLRFSNYFLRSSKIFNKSKYARIRQNTKTIFYWSLFINIFIIYYLLYTYLNLSFKFNEFWFIIWFIISFFLFKLLCKNNNNNNFKNWYFIWFYSLNFLQLNISNFIIDFIYYTFINYIKKFNIKLKSYKYIIRNFINIF